ncbi:MAG: hypothetical protein ACK51L_04100, partial [bacterium]
MLGITSSPDYGLYGSKDWSLLPKNSEASTRPAACRGVQTNMALNKKDILEPFWSPEKQITFSSGSHSLP